MASALSAGKTLGRPRTPGHHAKTVCDHLAVLRPQAWLMIGHCGGLRGSQKIGDYVLAHAYLRDDHVLDKVLPPEIPIPPLAEVQVALNSAAERITGETGDVLKRRLRTGTLSAVPLLPALLSLPVLLRAYRDRRAAAHCLRRSADPSAGTDDRRSAVDGFASRSAAARTASSGTSDAERSRL